MPPLRLIIFTRYPIPGLTKTRLIPALGEEGAAELQRAMTRHTVQCVRPLMAEGVGIEVRHDGGSPTLMERWLGKDLCYELQGEGDLGVRMERAFCESSWSGALMTVIIGTDCPDLCADDIKEAFILLESNPVVIGPATDGGYYLIGINADALEPLHNTVFSGIEWGTGGVFSGTVNALAEAGIVPGLLDEKTDVDEPEDLIHWEKIHRAEEECVALKSRTRTEPRSSIHSTASISVIIPTLNEENMIGEAIERLPMSEVEIIVADGGSTDRTADICREKGVRLVTSSPDRASQMNAGAGSASGQILLFLHADTRLPDGFEKVVRGVIASGGTGGAFAFGTDLDVFSMKLIGWAANVRARHLGIVLGDQAIFSRVDAFRKVGGFPEIPFMEDLEFVRCLKRQGKFVILRQRAVSSARRWRINGIWKTTLMNQAVMWLYLLGVGPKVLTRWYRSKEKR